jgi:hypothetical protein
MTLVWKKIDSEEDDLEVGCWVSIIVSWDEIVV